MSGSLEAERWDARYAATEANGEQPVAFVQKILAELGEQGSKQHGLYVGCGDGRNFIPLAKNGLNLRGIDISRVGTEQLVEKYPEAEGLVHVGAFTELGMSRVFDYLVATQVFQHGNTYEVSRNFRQARDVLKPGGKLFLRVNSASTEIVLKHHQTENNKYGGFTIVYDEEPKVGAKRHFFTHQELEVSAANNDFQIIQPLAEVVETREPPLSGTWTQWETVWKKV